jgi:hypothetical protein
MFYRVVIGCGIVFLCLCLVAGCRSTDRPIQKEQPTVTASAVQRFVPLPTNQPVSGVPWPGFLALDTQTGELCRTSEMEVGERFRDLASCYWLYEHEVSRNP